MAEKKIKTRIQHKHDFEAHWKAASGFIPYPGELIIYDKEVDAAGNVLTRLVDGVSRPAYEGTGRTMPYTCDKFKVGDGVTHVDGLPFANNPEIYIGDGEMPEGAVVQFILDDEEEDIEAMLPVSHNTDPSAHIDIRTQLNVLSGNIAEVGQKIPTAVSALTNDSGYLTNSTIQEVISSKVDESDLDLQLAIKLSDGRVCCCKVMSIGTPTDLPDELIAIN